MIEEVEKALDSYGFSKHHQGAGGTDKRFIRDEEGIYRVFCFEEGSYLGIRPNKVEMYINTADDVDYFVNSRY